MGRQSLLVRSFTASLSVAQYRIGQVLICFTVENASKTRIVLADSKIHILGGFQNIHIAKEAVVSLILGAPPGKVYGNLRTVAGRMKERF